MIDGLITCRELIEFIGDYVADELPAAQRDEFEKHLAVCPECQQYFESYKTTMRLGRVVFEHADDPVPNDVPADLIKAILAARSNGG